MRVPDLVVANVWADHAVGCRVGLAGLDAGEALEVRVDGPGPPGRLLGFGAVRTLCATRGWCGRSPRCSRPARRASGAGGRRRGRGPAVLELLDGLAAQLIHDELLEATVVHVEVDPISRASPPPSSTARVLDEVLRRMVASVGAAEVVEVLLP